MAGRFGVVLVFSVIALVGDSSAWTFSDLCKALPWGDHSTLDQAAQFIKGQRQFVVEKDFETGEDVITTSCTQSEAIQVGVILLLIALLAGWICVSCCCCSSKGSSRSRHQIVHIPDHSFVRVSTK